MSLEYSLHSSYIVELESSEIENGPKVSRLGSQESVDKISANSFLD